MEQLTASQHADAIEVAARAFHADPLFSFLSPDDERRARFLRLIFAAYVRLAPEHLAGVVVDGELAAMSLLIPSGDYPPSVLRAAPTILGSVMRGLRGGAVGLSEIGPLARAGLIVETAHPPGPFHYLELLAVAPGMQGRGLGSGMLRALNERVDSTAHKTVLETSKQANVRLYERYGFEVIGESRFDASPPIWTMQRDAPAH